jgi:hypothetical protein
MEMGMHCGSRLLVVIAFLAGCPRAGSPEPPGPGPERPPTVVVDRALEALRARARPLSGTPEEVSLDGTEQVFRVDVEAGEPRAITVTHVDGALATVSLEHWLPEGTSSENRLTCAEPGCSTTDALEQTGTHIVVLRATAPVRLRVERTGAE